MIFFLLDKKKIAALLQCHKTRKLYSEVLKSKPQKMNKSVLKRPSNKVVSFIFYINFVQQLPSNQMLALFGYSQIQLKFIKLSWSVIVAWETIILILPTSLKFHFVSITTHDTFMYPIISCKACNQIFHHMGKKYSSK